MSKTKHTPGPWYVEDPEAADEARDIYADANGRRSIIFRPTEADARLISAAPDLAAACEAALAYIPGSEVRSWPPGFRLREDALRQLAAALQKAGLR